MYRPVEYRELEIEHNGLYTFDKRIRPEQPAGYTTSIGYGVLPWWKIELEGEMARAPEWSGPSKRQR
jgi:hypothetical protein